MILPRESSALFSLLRGFGLGLLVLAMASPAAAQRTGISASPGVIDTTWVTPFDGDPYWDWPVGWNEPLATGDLDADGHDDLVYAEFGYKYSNTVQAWAASDGHLLWSSTYTAGYYNSVATHPDLDNDGRADVVLGGTEEVELRSGLDGSLISQIPSTTPWGYFGASVSALGDVNGDGVGEIIVGAPHAKVGSNWYVGSVFVYSGAAPLAAPILSYDGVNNYDLFGTLVRGTDDLDGDTFPDLLVSSYDNGTGVDIIHALSGDPSNPGTIWQVQGAVGQSLSYWLYTVDDLNGDGIRDLVTESDIRSGADGSVIRSAEEPQVLNDMDGDGVQDLIDDVGLSFPQGTLFEVAVVSGVSNQPLYPVCQGSLSDDEIWVTGGPDLNADGIHEYYVLLFPESGRPRVFLEQINPGIQTSTDTISLATGGSLVVNLDFTSRAAFQEYRIVTSASGVDYLPVGLTVMLPLEYDPTVFQTYNGQYPAFAAGMSGMLDQNGRATGTINFPPGLPGNMLGRTYTMSAMAGYPWGFWTATTSPRSYTFVP